MGEQPNDRREQAYVVFRRLRQHFGAKQSSSDESPLDQLVRTILSQNTADTNRDVAFAALKERYPTWQALAQAPLGELQEVIRPAGLVTQKSQTIKRALAEVERERGTYDLSFLDGMSTDEALEWLIDIKGIGPKTASIVLLFCFNKPLFPVDTHVHRVSRRLGLIDDAMSREQAHDELARVAPEGEFYEFHVNLIEHGRAICRARRPRCEDCFLTDVCDYYRENVA